MSEQVLYRKYRPKGFDEVVGQEHITRILQNAIKLGRVAHAYLFSGPRGTGKTTIARILAKSVNCEKNKDGMPCNMCDTCKEVASGYSLDLVEVDAASSRGIDEIRELREAVRLAPARAKYKVYIIDEVHMLTKEAFNALLKTLEEPPAHAIFILATTDIQKVPDTIISRCQHFEFKKIPAAAIVERLEGVAKAEGIKAEKEALQLIAFFADGGLRDAESTLGQVLAGHDKPVLEEGDVRFLLGAPEAESVSALIGFIAEKNAARAVELINQVIDEGADPQLYAKLIIRQMRHMMLSAINPQYVVHVASELSEEERSFISAKKDAFTLAELERILKIFVEAYWLSYRTIFPQLPLELAVIDILRDSLQSEKASGKVG